jgi:hypothetical protein
VASGTVRDELRRGARRFLAFLFRLISRILYLSFRIAPAHIARACI